MLLLEHEELGVGTCMALHFGIPQDGVLPLK
jgi:hypothetical protein